jgi:hypothetical protein
MLSHYMGLELGISLHDLRHILDTSQMYASRHFRDPAQTARYLKGEPGELCSTGARARGLEAWSAIPQRSQTVPGWKMRAAGKTLGFASDNEESLTGAAVYRVLLADLTSRLVFVNIYPSCLFTGVET